MAEIYNQTKDEITNDILADIPETYQKTVGFPIRDFIKAIAIFLAEILENVKKASFLDVFLEIVKDIFLISK